MKLLLLVLLIPGGFAASRPCCHGDDNRMVNKQCVDGRPFDALLCPSKYLIEKNYNNSLTVDENDHLQIAHVRIPPNEYCTTNINNNEVYIVCFSETTDHLRNKMFYVNAIMELISVFFLAITIVVYLHVPDMLDLQGISILHSISGLAVSFLVLASNQLSIGHLNDTLCILYAYGIYFSMLYAFFWLNVLSFHIWRTVAKPQFLKSQKYWSLVYHAIGIGGPTALLIILVVASSMEYSELHPGLGETKCWFKTIKAQFIYFYAPMAVLLCLNIAYYGWTITILWKNLKKCNEKKAKVLKYRLILCVKLFFIMGISWTFEVISAAFQDVHPALQIFWYITDTVNTLQGILIFLILVVCRKRVVRGLASRSFCGFIRLPGRWRTLADDECEEIEEEYGLSEVQPPPKN